MHEGSFWFAKTPNKHVTFPTSKTIQENAITLLQNIPWKFLIVAQFIEHVHILYIGDVRSFQNNVTIKK